MFIKTRIACIAFVIASMFTSIVSQAATFGPLTVKKLIVMPDQNGHQDWIDAIQGAKSSIHLAIYHLTDKDVIDALAKKMSTAPKGFDLRILVDGKSFTGGYQKAVQALTNANAQIRGSSPAFSIMHEKAMVIDGELAFITAINLTNTASDTRDFGIIFENKEIIKEMNSVFETDWLNAANGTGDTPPLSNPNLAWSPNNSQDKLISLVDSAVHTLVIQVESLSDAAMLDAFTRAAKRGVQVRIIVPMCVTGSPLFNYPALEKIAAGGVETHVMPYPSTFDEPYMHSKMMVADDQLIYVGSINYSVNSLEKARELGLLFTNDKVGAQMMQEFNKDWNRSVAPDADPKSVVCHKAS